MVEQGTSPSSQIILVDQLSRPTLVWTALAGNMRLEYAANGRLSRLVALDRDRTVEPLYSENGHSVTTLRTLKSSDGSHVSDVNLQRLAGESLKYVLAIEDDEYVRQVLDFGQEYLDLLMRNMGFDFDLNRTPRERDQCIAACEQTCSDGTTAYGTVITVAGIVAPPSAVIGGALFLGLIALDYTCRSNCKSSWRCR